MKPYELQNNLWLHSLFVIMLSEFIIHHHLCLERIFKLVTEYFISTVYNTLCQEVFGFFGDSVVL